MNNIKELRNKLKISQREFANRYNLSIRTLQQWEQGISKPIDSLIELINRDINNDSNLRYQYKYSKKDYKICITNPFLNCEKIYPIQQSKVKEIISGLSKDKHINKIIIFGSSITDRCHIGSDVDIYYETDNNYEINLICDFDIDVWNNKNVDERLKKEIDKKGVVVYARG